MFLATGEIRYARNKALGVAADSTVLGLLPRTLTPTTFAKNLPQAIGAAVTAQGVTMTSRMTAGIVDNGSRGGMAPTNHACRDVFCPSDAGRRLLPEGLDQPSVVVVDEVLAADHADDSALAPGFRDRYQFEILESKEFECPFEIVVGMQQ